MKNNNKNNSHLRIKTGSRELNAKKRNLLAKHYNILNNLDTQEIRNHVNFRRTYS